MTHYIRKHSACVHFRIVASLAKVYLYYISLESTRLRANIYALQPSPHLITQAVYTRLPGRPLNENLDELSDGLDLVDPFFEEADLVRHARFADLVHPERQLGDGGERDGSEVVAMRVDYDAVLLGGRGAEVAVLDQIRVDDGVVSLRVSKGPRLVVFQ